LPRIAIVLRVLIIADIIAFSSAFSSPSSAASGLGHVTTRRCPPKSRPGDRMSSSWSPGVSQGARTSRSMFREGSRQRIETAFMVANRPRARDVDDHSGRMAPSLLVDECEEGIPLGLDLIVGAPALRLRVSAQRLASFEYVCGLPSAFASVVLMRRFLFPKW
jgi:hypothetical protein